MNKTAIIFGASGGIGSAVVSELQHQYNIICVDRSTINFLGNKQQQVNQLLDRIQPDIVVNCVGTLGDNYHDYEAIFNINFGSNWSLIRYYMKHQDKSTKIIMIGSSAYKSGKKQDMLYSSSKAALYNLWQGASDWFTDSNILLGLVNPVRTRTQMTKHYTPGPELEPVEVAKVVTNLCLNMTHSQVIDMTFQGTK